MSLFFCFFRKKRAILGEKGRFFLIFRNFNLTFCLIGGIINSVNRGDVKSAAKHLSPRGRMVVLPLLTTIGTGFTSLQGS